MSLRFTGLASGIDTESMIQQLMKVQRMKVDRVFKEKTKVEWQKDIWKEMNKKLYDFYSKPLAKLRLNSTFTQKSVTSSNPGVATVTGNSSAFSGTHSLEVKSLAESSYLTGEEITTDIEVNANIDIQVKIDDTTTKTITINKDEIEAGKEIQSIVSQLKEQLPELNINYDANNKRIFMSTKEAGENIQIDFTGNTGDAEALLKDLGIFTTGTEGSTAKIIYNGTELTSNTNDFNVNGMSIKAQSIGTTNFTVSHDIDGMYNAIKDFITEYNLLITDINGKIYADPTTGYEPLTSEEKQAMSEDEIKLWEQTAKSSLLRRDSVLEGLTSSMRSTLSSSLDEGEYKTLASLGIVTGNYYERGILHIEGDADSLSFSEKDNKLRKALEENPEEVAKLFTKLGQEMYNDMGKRMRSTELSSALTFYNDKAMDDKIKRYDSEISKLEDRLSQVEARYYAQFTAMEKAMQAANSQMDWLVQQLGGL
jgi:flagellar hook-associated protein 2